MDRFSLFFAVVLGSAAQAQNLVPNGSFEEYTDCPDDLAELDRALGWSLFCGSPDYFNACADTAVVDVPSNGFGYQQAFLGQGYIGCYTYLEGPTVREFVQAELATVLTPGQPTYLSMRVSASGFDGSGSNYTQQYATNGIGMRFSTVACAPGLLITNQAALYLDEALVDTSEWVTLSGVYIPDSAYQFIQLGNFFADSTITPVLIDPSGASPGSYAFIDAVCVSHDPDYCVNHIGMNNQEWIKPLVFPNPVAEELHVTLPSSNGSLRISISDATGRVLYDTERGDRSRAHVVDVSYLPEGVYVLHMTDGASSFAPVRFVHIAH